MLFHVDLVMETASESHVIARNADVLETQPTVKAKGRLVAG
jgi:hypothetical protein